MTSAAFRFRSAGGARRAFAARDELAAFTASLGVKTRRSVPLGDEAELVRGQGLNAPATGVVWRFGNIVALVVVEPGSARKASELAEMQQTRIERPSLPTRKQLTENDPLLRLDDPSLRLPVYWLGRSFDPPGDLPAIELDRSYVGGAGPGQSIQLQYAGQLGGATLDEWQPAAWQRFTRTRLGRLIWDSPCAPKKVVQVAGGRAEIFEGYGEPNPVRPPCPARPPDRVVAHVYFDKIVVAVNMPYCYQCARGSTQRSGYATVEGTETLVRSLRLRTPRR